MSLVMVEKELSRTVAKVRSVPRIHMDSICSDAMDVLKQQDADCFLLTDGSKIVGYMMISGFYQMMGSRFGYSLYANKKISSLGMKQVLMLSAETSCADMIDEALARPVGDRYDVIFIRNGSSIGYVTIADLLELSAQTQKEMQQEQVALFRKMESRTLHIQGDAHELREVNHRGKELAEKMSDRADAGSDQVERVLRHVKRQWQHVNEQQANVTNLGEKIEVIRGVVDTIEEIADKVNILSLNAAVEAARAGEAGRSFSVVAAEVRKLAEASKQSASSIEGVIADIIASIQDTSTKQNQTQTQMASSKEMIEELHRSFNMLQEDISGFMTELTYMWEKGHSVSEKANETHHFLEKVQEMS
ncbi:hypothetical protein FLK61_23795 [Paenalkalicoccus suaedae]|uniref:Methyl-accepting transducer domain-containing protein n=1 Tax=Paenalkalicoccus suaedae TaxID=2592382 RepID=A0A859FC04_9BACI|nr:methyl-accepting chemotaxis protein [Paenalkalicoccus suaedae]QKS69815.1 hypothetical protein FLK61_23795 [Paenalkalicoccus suaedae]